ncbi:hypothetical protein [Streptomyces graminilatus]|uniref:hypothetical protein n=1 Tax=Streptomyces graminilatus TaxID=1464070 RepID=UPI0006E1B582|nr:hypothetical protein [Streptomyces graminilatus]
MSKELRDFTVAATVHSPDNLPHKDGEQMYADDVVEEMRDAVTAALDEWYQRRGHELLACEPLVG